MEDKEKQASYTSLIESPLRFVYSIGKTFFFTKVGDKQLGLRSLASFTNVGPDT